MQTHLRVGLQQRGDPRGLVRRKVIGNHMNLFPLGLMSHKVRQEGGELLGGVSVGRLAEHLARLGIERGVEGQRTACR